MKPDNNKCLSCWNFMQKKCAENVLEGDSDINISECPKYCFDKEKVRAMYPLLDKTPMKKRGWKRAASVFFNDNPKSLYRFLYIWGPKQVDFSDMYKCTFAIIDLGKGLVYLDLFKYELAAYFYVPPSELKPQPVQAIEMSCGVPGTEDVEFIEDSKAIEVFEEFITLLEREHDIYPGSDFRV